jgi:hypothetical protein
MSRETMIKRLPESSAAPVNMDMARYPYRLRIALPMGKPTRVL